IPPATPTSRSPARTAWSRIPAERMPEAQTLLIVSEGTSLGMPPLIWAWREGICPCPAWSTCPKATPWTWSGATSARSSAAAMAVPPRSGASRLASPPPIFPKGVRAAPRITVLGMVEACLLIGGRQRYRRGAPSRDGRRAVILGLESHRDTHTVSRAAWRLVSPPYAADQGQRPRRGAGGDRCRHPGRRPVRRRLAGGAGAPGARGLR